MMRPEQEKVRNLLTDTVTLLCKNGLTYQDELRVEALIAITVDSNDVFIVHINEKFDSNGEKKTSATPLKDTSSPVISERPAGEGKDPPEDCPASSGEDGEEERQAGQVNNSQNASLTQQGSSAQNENTRQIQTEDSDPGDGSIVIKIEDDDEDEEKYSSVPRSPDSVAQRAAMVAGQRRVLAKRHHHHQSHDTEVMQQSYVGMDSSARLMEDGRFWNTSHGPSGEPSVKRPALSSSLDYYIMGPDHVEMAHNPFQQEVGGDAQLLPVDGGRAGCSSWPVVGGLQRTNQQADMTQKNSLTARFPNFGFANYRVKQLLTDLIVNPVLESGGMACSFRMGWFGKMGENLDEIWLQQVYLRQIIDGHVNQTPGVAFVMSALTGTASNPCEDGMRKTYPAVAYWVVSRDVDFNERCILPPLQQLQLGTTLKPLHQTSNKTRAKLTNSLCVVLKDNIESYVRRMTDASVVACQGQPGEERHPIVKVYVKDMFYWTVLETAQARLEQEKFSITLEKMEQSSGMEVHDVT